MTGVPLCLMRGATADNSAPIISPETKLYPERPLRLPVTISARTENSWFNKPICFSAPASPSLVYRNDTP